MPEAAALPRAMVLRSELAARTGDDSSARHWAAAAVALLQRSDPELAPIVARMRVIAAP
jgi:hypothetical protein